MAGSHAPRPRKNRDTLHNEEWLRARYLDERLSANDIARLLGCSQPSVLWALRKFAIPVRSNAEGKRGRPSTTVWTPEMREALAAKRRGDANPMAGRDNPTRRGPNYHPDKRLQRVRAARAYRKGVTGETYDRMFAEQGGLCVVCQQPETKRHRSGSLFTLSVDHDHVTGKVRALLCNNCNAALGLLKEDPTRLRALLAYIEHHKP